MNNLLKVLRNIVVVLAIMVGTAALTVWFMMLWDRRQAHGRQTAAPPVVATKATAMSAIVDEGVRSPDGDLDWSRDELRMLKEHVSNRTILSLLELLREREGAPVNYHELMKRTGRTMPQVRADLASFSRAVKKVDGHQKWPISIAPSTDNESRIAYTVPKTYLDWWFED